jgi:uncharacterized protein YhbP (UPF0306 family)
VSGDALLRRVQLYLGEHHVMTVATVGPDGPGAAAVFYAHRGSMLYFLSSATSRHARNIEVDPRVALTIQDECADWSRIRGLQLEGQARRLAAAEAAAARELYTTKFPFIGAVTRIPAALLDALNRIDWYEVRADRGWLIDNALGFGHRDELRFA